MDTTARVIGGLGILIGLGSIAFTYYLWYRSGPRIRVSAFVKVESSAVRIEVRNVGRLAAIVSQIELRDFHVLARSYQGNTLTTSRWTLSVQSDKGPLPQELAPTDFLVADVSVDAILVKADNAREIVVRAWAQRGDGQWSQARDTVRVR
jgi:hypothetical protein